VFLPRRSRAHGVRSRVRPYTCLSAARSALRVQPILCLLRGSFPRPIPLRVVLHPARLHFERARNHVSGSNRRERRVVGVRRARNHVSGSNPCDRRERRVVGVRRAERTSSARSVSALCGLRAEAQPRRNPNRSEIRIQRIVLVALLALLRGFEDGRRLFGRCRGAGGGCRDGARGAGRRCRAGGDRLRCTR
jgi:hypothetical protein